MWPDTRILDLFGIELPIVQAPMAGAGLADMAVAVAEAGGLGSFPCALLDAGGLRTQFGIVRRRIDNPIDVNFFCHRAPAPDPARGRVAAAARRPLSRARPRPAGAGTLLAPHSFDAEFCALVEELRPEVVSFHFDLPDDPLLDRARATGARIVSSATMIHEARWLEAAGCDSIIAQGLEASGHRGMFRTDRVEAQIGIPVRSPRRRSPCSID